MYSIFKLAAFILYLYRGAIADLGGTSVNSFLDLGASRESMPHYLRYNAKSLGSKPAFREKEYGIWQSWSWAEVEENTDSLALGFLKLGIKEGDFVAIIGRNRPHFYWTMLASHMVGAVPVPLYQDAVAEEMSYVLGHCGARFIVVDDQEQVDKVLEVKQNLPNLEQLIYVDPRGLRKYDHSKLHSFEAIQEQGRGASAEQKADLEQRIGLLTYDSICIILYTSGTTGRPKGVVLSNRNIIVSALNACSFDGLGKTDELLSYLPMAWVGDFIFSFGQSLVSGLRVNFPENRETAMSDLKEIGPSYYFAPPRIFENMLTTVVLRIQDAGKFKRNLYSYFMKHAEKVGSKILDKKPVSLIDRLKYTLGEFFIYGPLKNDLGLNRVRVGYTAGEAIGPEIFEFFRSLGINLKQLYGQTEASVFITVQPDGQVRSDTVGIPAPEVELKIGENGEVYYRSPGAFVEYFKNPESTGDTKDSEGWVATGDAGFIEKESGHLRIIDRAKDVSKLSSGAMFAPKYVENKLKFFPNILEAVLFGAGKEYCVAFINIDLNAVGNWAERNNIAYASYQELAGHPKVLDMIKEHVDKVNSSVANDEMLSGCQIRRFLVLHKELDADDGEMTRTRKVRRRIISEKYQDLIDALYDGQANVSTETEVTYEDGRKGKIKATIEMREATVVSNSNPDFVN